MQLIKITLPYILLFFMVPMSYLSQMAIDVCRRMKPVNNVMVNLTECKLMKFSELVPTYFCTDYCDSLPDCQVVAMERRKVTSWCCAFRRNNMSVCEGNQTLFYINGAQLVKQRESCSLIKQTGNIHVHYSLGTTMSCNSCLFICHVS